VSTAQNWLEGWPSGEGGFSVRHLRLPDGERVRVVEAAESHGEAVLLLHGWGASAYSFRYAIPAIARAGFHPVAMDLRGHGASDKPRERSRYSLRALEDQVLSVLDALGLIRVSVLGHSLGGLLAGRLAVRAPARVARLVLATPVGLGHVTASRLFRHIPPVLAILDGGYTPRWLIDRVLRHAYGTLREPSARDVTEYWRPSREPGFQYAALSLLNDIDWRMWTDGTLDMLAATRIPILTIFGGRDRVIASVPQLPSMLQRLHARSLTVPEAGHVVLEEAPDAVHPELLAFLGE
jgi:pimeloyl-ACP methyl ester carboxylesterase